MVHLNRDEFRGIKNFTKEQLEKYLQNYYNLVHNTIYNTLRKEFESAYKDELDNSIQNFITAIVYTLHFSEEVDLKHDELNSFMDDLFTSVDMFRSGEYNPEEYREQLKRDGVEIASYDYSRLYREKDAPYKEICERLIEFINKTKSKAKIVDEIRELLGIKIKTEEVDKDV